MRSLKRCSRRLHHINKGRWRVNEISSRNWIDIVTRLREILHGCSLICPKPHDNSQKLPYLVDPLIKKSAQAQSPLATPSFFTQFGAKGSIL